MKRNRPKAIFWYEVYCHIFGLLNLFTAWEGYQITRKANDIVREYEFFRSQGTAPEMVAYWELVVGLFGWVLMGVGLAFGVAAFVLPRTHDSKKMWVAHLVHLIFGISSVILIPLCLPVLLAWLKPDVKEHYGILPPVNKKEAST